MVPTVLLLLLLIGTVSVSSSSVVQAFSNPDPSEVSGTSGELSPELSPEAQALMDESNHALAEYKKTLDKKAAIWNPFEKHAKFYGKKQHTKNLAESITNDFEIANDQVETIKAKQLKLQQSQNQQTLASLQFSIDKLTSAVGRIRKFVNDIARFEQYCSPYQDQKLAMKAALEKLEEKWDKLSYADKLSLNDERNETTQMTNKFGKDYEKLKRAFYHWAFSGEAPDKFVSIVKVLHQNIMALAHPTNAAIYRLGRKMDDKLVRVINGNAKPNNMVKPITNDKPISDENPITDDKPISDEIHIIEDKLNNEVKTITEINQKADVNSNVNSNVNIKTNSKAQYCLKCIKVSATITGLMAFGALIGKVIDDSWNYDQDHGGYNGSLNSLVNSSIDPTGGAITLEPSSIGPIIIGAIVLIVLLIALVYFLVSYSKRASQRGHDPETGKSGKDIPSGRSSIDSTGVNKSKAKSHKQVQSSSSAKITSSTGTPLTTTQSNRTPGSKVP